MLALKDFSFFFLSSTSANIEFILGHALLTFVLVLSLRASSSIRRSLRGHTMRRREEEEEGRRTARTSPRLAQPTNTLRTTASSLPWSSWWVGSSWWSSHTPSPERPKSTRTPCRRARWRSWRCTTPSWAPTWTSASSRAWACWPSGGCSCLCCSWCPSAGARCTDAERHLFDPRGLTAPSTWGWSSWRLERQEEARAGTEARSYWWNMRTDGVTWCPIRAGNPLQNQGRAGVLLQRRVPLPLRMGSTSCSSLSLCDCLAFLVSERSGAKWGCKVVQVPHLCWRYKHILSTGLSAGAAQL